MPTDPIDSLSGIMRALRRRMAESSEKRPAAGSDKTATSTTRTTTTTGGDIGALRRRIEARLGGLPASERGSAQAQRIFVETVLVWEFGDQIVQDPAFSQLLARVQDALAAEPDARRRFFEMISQF